LIYWPLAKSLLASIPERIRKRILYRRRKILEKRKRALTCCLCPFEGLLCFLREEVLELLCLRVGVLVADETGWWLGPG
jgi:hypothetical protein